MKKYHAVTTKEVVYDVKSTGFLVEELQVPHEKYLRKSANANPVEDIFLKAFLC